ncbi:MAG TPA: alpha/beta hydrolase [Pseudomonas sp.]|uniref:alpha/beta hydrolase n=1 Tax=Pseudomonas sp. TaxID=306 RepID=UPI002B4A713B|nr:alpha/beta hydrolase [Pseudomonas sp.]HKS15266.1 alpha/beta hydrolase [Pseudomonas sp.]
MLKPLLACLALLHLSGCTTAQDRLLALASASDAEARVLQTPLFPLQVVAPKALPLGKPLTIYIEGDGHAWATATQPSLDPSPHALGITRLALDARHPGVYLARPCQFVMNRNCQRALWTDARFSVAVIESMQSAVDALKARYRASSLELIGYSGGAAVALLLAERRDDVVQLQTIAGNLDPVAWVKLDRLSPLADSMDPLDDTGKLATIVQRHFVGADDKVIKAELGMGYLRKVRPECAQVVVVPGTHASVVKALSSELLDRPITCQ